MKTIFPLAIEHKIPRNKIGGKDYTCRFCRKEQESKSALSKRLEQWQKTTLSRDGRVLKKLFEEPRTNYCDFGLERIVKSFGQSNLDKEIFFLIDKRDLKLWRKIIEAAKVSKKKFKDDGQALKNNIKELISKRGAAQSDLEDDCSREQLLACAFRPLKCKHNMVLREAVFQDGLNGVIKNDYDEIPARTLSSRVEMITEETYKAFIDSWKELAVILASDQSRNGTENESTVIDLVNSDEEDSTDDLQLPKELQHPRVHLLQSHDVDDFDEQFTLSKDGSKIPFQMLPRVCLAESCHKKFSQNDDFVAGDGNESDTEKSKSGSAMKDEVVVIDDNEESPSTFELKVYEIDEKRTLVEGLTTLLDLRSRNASANIDGCRRSTRARKTKFPYDALLEQCEVQIGLHHNIASLRLFLLEKCDFPLDQILTFVVMQPEPKNVIDLINDAPTENDNDQDEGPPMYTLEFGNNEMTLEDVCKIMTKGSDPKLEKLGNPSSTLVLFRQSTKNGDNLLPKDALMDTLLAQSNSMDTSDDKGSSTSKGSKGSTRAERGFQGTFLSRGARQTTKKDKSVNENNESSTSSKPDKNETKLDKNKKDDMEEELDNNRAKKKLKLTPIQEEEDGSYASSNNNSPTKTVFDDSAAMMIHQEEEDVSDRIARITQNIIREYSLGNDLQEKCWSNVSAALENHPTDEKAVFQEAVQMLFGQ